jgi:hypothetical protein
MTQHLYLAEEGEGAAEAVRFEDPFVLAGWEVLSAMDEKLA